ncbi:MAG: hypothetical protein Q8N84_01105 [bacterium]|nr:hypothetical protein [bacterium]
MSWIKRIIFSLFFLIFGLIMFDMVRVEYGLGFRSVVLLVTGAFSGLIVCLLAIKDQNKKKTEIKEPKYPLWVIVLITVMAFLVLRLIPASSTLSLKELLLPFIVPFAAPFSLVSGVILVLFKPDDF